uniref:Uncharacterized protein n=1 Tax=Amphimedon queenslandica TaxID=400682 RepID=A0A1X7VLU8_AMPQE
RGTVFYDCRGPHLIVMLQLLEPEI